PENEMPLWRAISRRIPGVSVAQDCSLDRALELWFAAPEEFSQFLSKLEEVKPRMDPDEHRLGMEQAGDDVSQNLGSASVSHIRVNPCESVVAPPENETDDQTYERLARLSPGEYDRARQPEATRLGIR